jgi:hypothetical protein
VATLPDKELRQFSELLEQVCVITASAGAKLTIYSGLGDTVQQELARRDAA